MKELCLLDTIKNSLTCSSFLGDDCACIDELGIIVTHDTLVENVHFSLYTTSPYLLGRKAVSVNLSDISAALAEPKYITVSISLPSNISESFVSELYRGINDVCNEFKVCVVGGDITGGKEVVISVCAIGKRYGVFSSSRKFAKKGDYIVTTGFYGASSAGFYALSNFLNCEELLINSHLNPSARVRESRKLADCTDSDIAVMDTSDGLVDALYKIALASKHSLEVYFDKIPVSEELINFSGRNGLDYGDFVKWGGEDFELVACVPEETYIRLDNSVFKCIGRVLNKDNNPVVVINYKNKSETINKEIFEHNSYNHFGE